MVGHLGFGALQVHQVERHLFPLTPLHAVVADVIGLDAIFAHQVKAAVFQVKLDVGGEGRQSQNEQRDECPPHMLYRLV